MDSIACKVGDQVNNLLHFIGADSLVGSCGAYGRIIIFAAVIVIIGLIAIWGSPSSDGEKSKK